MRILWRKWKSWAIKFWVQSGSWFLTALLSRMWRYGWLEVMGAGLGFWSSLKQKLGPKSRPILLKPIPSFPQPAPTITQRLPALNLQITGRTSPQHQPRNYRLKFFRLLPIFRSSHQGMHFLFSKIKRIIFKLHQTQRHILARNQRFLQKFVTLRYTLHGSFWLGK